MDLEFLLAFFTTQTPNVLSPACLSSVLGNPTVGPEKAPVSIRRYIYR